MAQPPPRPVAGPGGPPGPSDGGPPGGPQPVQKSKRLQQTQAQVDEVVDIMRQNVDKVLERDQKLSELDDRADGLLVGASQFEQSASKLKKKFWWKNMKMMLIMGGVVSIIVIILIVWISNKAGGGDDKAIAQGFTAAPSAGSKSAGSGTGGGKNPAGTGG